jgi:DNA-binding IclR family transcriptional regulator
VSESVRAVERSLDILLCFNQSEPVQSLTEIARLLHMPKSTAHRLLATLEANRFVNRDNATGLYHLGLRFIGMASLVLDDIDFPRWAQPYLQRLCAECGETVDLAVLDGAHVIFLQVVESPQRVKIAAAIGQRLPAHCTASGKAFMAYLPSDQVSRILAAGLARYTPKTRVVPTDLFHELASTRERGFAISEQEYEKDINAVAAPILDASRFPLAVIAAVGPSYRFTRERMLSLGQSVRETAEAIACEVGLTAVSMLVSRTATSGLLAQTEQRG